MNDEELQTFLGCTNYSFGLLSDEWKAWARAVILSAAIDTGGKGAIQREDAVLYLCQIMLVLEGIQKGITADSLRGKFVSGIVVCGFPPDTDTSFSFLRALQDAQSRGFVAYEDVGWGREEKRFYRLELAGQKLAESVTIAESSNNPTDPAPVQKADAAEPTLPTDSEAVAKDVLQPRLTVGLATIIMGCKALQIFAEIRRLYPHVIANEEAEELHSQLTEAIEFWLSHESDSVKGYREVYHRPTLDQLFTEEIMGVMTGAAMIATNTERDLEKQVEQVFQQAQLMALEPVRSVLKRLTDAQTFDCREVDSAAGPEYADPRRALYLLGKYWNVLRLVVIAESQAMIYHVPHSLTPVLVNLRERINGCFDRLGDIAGKDDARDTMRGLLACLLEGDTMDLQAAEEHSNRQFAQTEVFLQEARLSIGRKTFVLTFAEDAFFRVARQVAEEYKRNTESQATAVDQWLNGHEFVAMKKARRATAESNATKQVVSPDVPGKPNTPVNNSNDNSATPSAVILPDHYDRMVCTLISRLTDGLPLPDMDMTERNEQRVAVEVHKATGMTPERWGKLSKAEREPWLERTLEILDSGEAIKAPFPIKQVESVTPASSGVARDATPFQFTHEGAVYRVRYDGESGTISATLAGARYIYELLQHPHQGRKATELRGAVESGDCGKTDQDESQQALKKCHEELERVDAEIDDAKRDGNEVEQAELTEQRDGILAEVKRLTGLGGKPRRKSTSESARVSVANSIDLVIEKCRETYGLPKFAAHLDEAIEKGARCAYRPANLAPDWQF